MAAPKDRDFYVGERITAWNYAFTWTPDHLSLSELWPMKFTYDTLASDALVELNELSASASSTTPDSAQKIKQIATDTNITPPNSNPNSTPNPNPNSNPTSNTTPSRPPRRDLYTLLSTHHASSPTLTALWTQLHTVPPWVSWPQIARGQDVFYRYGGAALTGLTFQSLLGGMGAQKVVETLARTGGFSPAVARHRLLETTQHILQVTKSVDALRPGSGEGWVSTVRVRLLHASVRRRILKLAQEKDGYYDVSAFGVPVNDLDSIGTIGTFCAALIWLSFPRLGIKLREQEIQDYIALWRYVAYLIGTPDEWFSTPAKAKAIMECLLVYEIDPSETSKILANNVVTCLANKPPTHTSAHMLVASARWLNGDALCDALSLPPSTLYYRALMAGQCVVFMFFAYAYRYVPALDRAQVAFMRRNIWKVIVENKSGLGGSMSVFGFKYVPQYATITDMGAFEGGRHSYVEWRNLQALIIAGGVCGVLLGSSLKILGAVVGW